MSAASKTPVSAPYGIKVSSALSADEQQVIANLLALLPDSYISEVKSNLNDEASIKTDSTIIIKGFVDGRGLACPMPLLKTKVALREVAVGESLYIVATDPNSQADITAFCRQSQANSAASLVILVNTVTDNAVSDDKKTQAADTIFHFIITKTDSN
ncbi:sulfurtransferase TusA family protein [Psychrobacter sp. 1Y11]|uniref:sulfurtransferase TusA family protein n=1 Tax=Psychrobacter sp. 1Y11 TaxID=3457446 RepID=UPI003FD2B54A